MSGHCPSAFRCVGQTSGQINMSEFAVNWYIITLEESLFVKSIADIVGNRM